ncbi:alanyl-tRNA editing protein [Donghicola eburneus]|uniref:Alanine--tRNA ligase n=1 Tax=Donghicola eburneus TaxID=393278 RepID=A0A1M4MYT9_9RHOB|nr:alanyl-tRNA editing protein [Donghicola eburneus]SCM67742.1 Ala-tRNA(Pro) hydrolase [Donghicola eburneus]SFQ11837.1 Ala-tRNA(Pro) hydrolase [Donghicola eburneus]
MTDPLFRDDSYLRSADGNVTRLTDEGGIVLDQTVFYPTGGGQPGDSGTLVWDGGRIEIATTIKGEGDEIILVPGEPAPLPSVGSVVRQELDWERRHHHMRVHTALHLLSVVVPLPVTGGSISEEKGRLDFDMEEAPEDKQAIQDALNALVDRDLMVTTQWISDEDLDANPGLIKTMSVKPPRGTGRVRLVRIGDTTEQVDLQPCGGTHVRSTSEIGSVRIGKVEKKGRQNRRINLHID